MIPANPRQPSPRPGFTLVELIVVMTLILILASLAVAFIPSLNDRQRGSLAASLLQNWLVQARQRALRDGAPRGLRMLTTNPVSGLCQDFQYIEQPDRIAGTGNVNITAATVSGVTTTTIRLVDVDYRSLIAQNDWISVDDGLWSQITSPPTLQTAPDPVIPNHDVTTFTVRTTSSFPPALAVVSSATVVPNTPVPPAGTPIFYTGATYLYSIARATRPLAGESPLTLPVDTGVYPGTGTGFPTQASPTTTPPLPPLLPTALGNSTLQSFVVGGSSSQVLVPPADILFGPNGQVIQFGPLGAAPTAPANGKIVFWVQGTDPSYGEPSLIVVYVNTGSIAAHPVGPTGNEFQFITDGRGSGL